MRHPVHTDYHVSLAYQPQGVCPLCDADPDNPANGGGAMPKKGKKQVVDLESARLDRMDTKFRQVNLFPDLATCELCGVLVSDSGRDLHDRWHKAEKT